MGRVIHELERRLRVTEPVINFLTVRIDEEQKRLDKIKELRDARKKVSAQPAAAAPATEEAGAARKLRQRLRNSGQCPGGSGQFFYRRRERFDWPVITDHWPLTKKENYG